MFRNLILLTVVLAAGLGGCGRKPAKPQGPSAPPPEAVYVAPPSVTSVSLGSAGVLLQGGAPARARIRLATPQGRAQFAQVDAAGRWSLSLPASPDVRIFGLSALTAGRQVQAQGYVLLAPQGQAALLRAGAGALRLDRRPAAAIGAVDFDREGSTLVSGTAPPQAYVSLEIDGQQAAQGRADAAGRYAIALPAAIHSGRHSLEVVGDGFSETARIEASPAQPLAPGPIHSQVTSEGVRIDWPTPGGGVQSTVLVN